MFIPRLRIVLTTLLCASLACSVFSNVSNSGGSVENGPILGMLPASSVDQQGQAVDAKFTFDPSTSQIAVVAQVGNLDAPAPMTITWYRVTDQGDLQLFVDTVQVSALDRAWSIGKNPGTLTPGQYKIVAALNGQTQEVDITVSDPTQQLWTDAGGGAPITPTVPANSNVSAQVQQGAPISGGSGRIADSSRQSASASSSTSGTKFQPVPTTDVVPGMNGSTGAGCILLVYNSDSGGYDVKADGVLLTVHLSGCDAADVQVNATVNGAPQSLVRMHFAATQGEILPPDQSVQPDPCSLPGRNDLPGTVVKFSARVTNGKAAGLSTQLDIPLAKDTTPPTIDPPIFQPGSGQKVKAGQAITITVTAKDSKTSASSWQSGLYGVRAKDENGWMEEYDLPSVKVCDPDKGIKGHVFHYTVPNKTHFQLCIQAKDNAGNLATPRCATYYTGEHWTGTMQSNSLTVYDNTGQGTLSKKGTWETKFDLAVDGQGNITGAGESKLTSGCEPWPWQTDPEATGIKFDVTGTAYQDHLELHLNFVGLEGGTVNCGFGEGFFSGQPIEVPLTSPATAEGPANESADIAAVNHFSSQGTIALKCDNCAPGVSLNDPILMTAQR